MTFTAEAEEGYTLSLLKFDPETEYTGNEDGSFSFVMPEADVTVSAAFAMPMLLGKLMAKKPVPYVYYTVEGNTVSKHDGVCEDYEIVTEDTLELVDGKWYVVSSDLETTINVIGTANLILCDDVTLSTEERIMVNAGNTLNIYAQTAGTGAIVADNRGR